jgi:hypothetical protein
MNIHAQKPSSAWMNFTYFSTAISLVVVGSLIAFSPIPDFIKISIAVTTCWALHNAVNVTKLLRDKQEFEDWERGQKYEARAVSLDAA